RKVFLIGMMGVVGIFVFVKKPLAVADEVPIFVELEAIEPTVFVKEERLNITEPKDERSTDRLEMVLEKQEVGRWNGFNTMRKIVRLAIERGVSTNIVVLLLLLPVIATLVSFLHYMLGLRGYGIFTPTMVAVTFLNTGIGGGLLLFASILLISLLSRLITKKLRLHFWPARSINLLFISLGTFFLMMVSSFFSLFDISKISIFPVLFMIMLAEDFVRTQLAKSKKEAKRLTVETLVLSILGAIVMNIRLVQEMSLLYPEMIVFLVLTLNLLVGNYGGMRLTEIRRFKKAIRQ
ncbi:hypothetical protein KKE45_01425, partial [Patescibacteria group bacterium]|nr:hypothetical protein [Patescibacteria group bacterium]